MATHIYKCPNCDAELTFDPKRENFYCGYCASRFSKEELDALDTAKQADAKQEKDAADTADTTAEGELKLYSCPSCGAEIVADATTAATFCFYCHSPVILTGKLAGEFKPDHVIPFKVDKSEVQAKLLEWCKHRRFIDNRFFNESQMEKLSGVYFPYWIVSTDLKSSFKAKGTDLRVWMVGDVEYTETSIYQIDRDADITLSNLTLKALSRDDTKLLKGLAPYNLQRVKPFDMAYLSGFYAEKRNIEKKNLITDAHAEFYAAAKVLQENDVTGCGALSDEECRNTLENETWNYTLLPAWMLTYQYGGETYYFAMNGQTGKVAGRVPLSKSKLWTLGLSIGGGLFLLIMILRMLLC